MATVGNVIPKCSCQKGDSGIRIRFLIRWTKNSVIVLCGMVIGREKAKPGAGS